MASPPHYISIAGLSICIENRSSVSEILIPSSFHDFITEKKQHQVSLQVLNVPDGNGYRKDDPHSMIQGEMEIVNRAVHELPEIPAEMDPPHFLWQVYRAGKGYSIQSWSYGPQGSEPVILDFEPGDQNFRLFVSGSQKPASILGFPVGGLFIYLLTLLQTSLLVHGSCISYQGKGYLFLGRSGTGKSTMADIWEKAGATLIHDDRLLLVRSEKGWNAFSTPVNRHDKYLECPIQRIFIISHGDTNKHTGLSGIDATAAIMEHCVQHQYDQQMIAALLESVRSCSTELQVGQLAFRNNPAIVDFILNLND